MYEASKPKKEQREKDSSMANGTLTLDETETEKNGLYGVNTDKYFFVIRFSCMYVPNVLQMACAMACWSGCALYQSSVSKLSIHFKNCQIWTLFLG